MDIQWYPGHMTKTKRMIAENLKLIDIIVELLDARLPYSSQNSDFADLLKQKPRLILLNKADLADAEITKRWQAYLSDGKTQVLAINSCSGDGMNKIIPVIKSILAESIQRDRNKGISKLIRAMIVGIPNVGKSSFINRLSKKGSAKVGDKPGVTRGKQWIKLSTDLELLDTPGILMPKFSDQIIARKLAFTGAIKDDILDVEDIVFHLLEFLKKDYKNLLMERYKLTDDICDMTGYEILCYICKKRGFVVSGGEFDTLRGANIVLDEFRSSKLGKISLETPEDME